MPTTAANRNLLPASFWQDFRSKIAAVCKENNADWYDLSDCGLFQQSDYLDTVHLNAYGAIRLFPVLAERMTMFEPAKKALSK
jgi:lysophospholipase L1-like esterase